jgi:hypothetical protein
MLVVKLVMPLMLDDAPKANVAEDAWLTTNIVLSRFQVKVIVPSAVVGLQIVFESRRDN